MAHGMDLIAYLDAFHVMSVLYSHHDDRIEDKKEATSFFCLFYPRIFIVRQIDPSNSFFSLISLFFCPLRFLT